MNGDESFFSNYVYAPLEGMLAVVESAAFPQNRLKIVVNRHLAQMCLSCRSQSLLSAIESFNGNFALQEKFIKQNVLDHLEKYRDGGCLVLRLMKYFLSAVAKLELHHQIVAKTFALFRKVAIDHLLCISGSEFTAMEHLTFDSCKPLIDLVLSILGSKCIICPRFCDHKNCFSFQLAVSIVRTFLLSAGEGYLAGGNRLKVLSLVCGSASPDVREGLVIRLINEETLSDIEKWLRSHKYPPEHSTTNAEDNKQYPVSCLNGVSVDSFKAKYCTAVSETFQSLGVHVVFCQKYVDSELIFECSRRSILVIDRLGAEDCIYMQTLLDVSGALWPTSYDATNDCAKLTSSIGLLSSVDVLRFGQSKKLVNFLPSTEKPLPFNTLIVSLPIEDLLPDLQALCECSVASLKLTLANRGFVLKGGGHWQVELANSLYEKVRRNLDQFSRELGLPSPQIIRCLTAFCTSIAHTGIRVNHSMLENLRKELYSSVEASFLVEFQMREEDCDKSDMDNGSHTKPSFAIYDCFLTCRSAFDTACCCVLTLLATDRFIDEKNTRRHLENIPTISK